MKYELYIRLLEQGIRGFTCICIVLMEMSKTVLNWSIDVSVDTPVVL